VKTDPATKWFECLKSDCPQKWYGGKGKYDKLTPSIDYYCHRDRFHEGKKCSRCGHYFSVSRLPTHAFANCDRKLIVKSKRSQLAEIQGPAAIMAVADGPNSSWSMINGISLKKETKFLPHDVEEDEDEVDSNRSRGDELDNEEYYSLFVPATKDMTTQTSNPDEEVEFTNCKQEDDGIDNGIIGCAANGKESEERLVLDLMKRLEKLEEMDAERIEMEMEKNKRIDSLERNVKY
jgi:hypothetical protein